MGKDIKKLGCSAVVALGAFIIIISCFLTYVSASALLYSESTTLWKGGDGKIFIILAIVCIVLTFLNANKSCLISAILLSACTIYEIQDVYDVRKELRELKSVLKFGRGYYLMIAGTVILFLGAVVKVVLVNKKTN